MKNNDFKSTFSLLNVDYVRLNKNWNYRNVISPFYRIYLIDEGYGSLGSGQEGVTLEKGYLYLIPSFTVCNHQCPETLGQFYAHIIEETAEGQSMFAGGRKIEKIASQPSDFEYFKRLLHLNPGRGLPRSDNPQYYEKPVTLSSFQEQNNYLTLSAHVETRGLIMMLLSRFLTSGLPQIEGKQKVPSKISETINFMLANLQQPLTVESLSAMAGLNSNYFSRLFLRYTGMRPLAYLQAKRIERAQFLILTTKLTLSDIAAETGFESLSYFSRVFKSVTGHSPTSHKLFNRIV